MGMLWEIKNQLEWPSLMHTRLEMALQTKNECANNFQFLSLPFYAHLSFLQKLYKIVNDHCHQLIHHQADVVTIAMTTASISLV